jgi:hypothetical protein
MRPSATGVLRALLAIAQLAARLPQCRNGKEISDIVLFHEIRENC